VCHFTAHEHSSAECTDSSASFLISCATTEKPLPASPALAASMDAFKLRRFVCSAISLIVPMIFPVILVVDPVSSAFHPDHSCFQIKNNGTGPRLPVPLLKSQYKQSKDQVPSSGLL